jgi:hypothetical protein
VVSPTSPTTFDEVVAAVEQRLGQTVKVGLEKDGRVRRWQEGRLEPPTGGDGAPLAIRDEDGRARFNVGPGLSVFLLDPRMVVGAEEQPERARLRVGLIDGAAFLIEAPGAPARDPRRRRRGRK